MHLCASFAACNVANAKAYTSACLLSTCNTGWKVSANKRACEANKCSCANGVAPTGAKCASDGAKVCESCNSGFKLSHAFSTAVRITSSQKPWQNTKWAYGAGDRDKPWTVRLWVKRDSSLKRSGDNMCAIFSR